MATNPFLKISPDKLLALAIYSEASGEGYDGMIAVGNVIKNRTKNLATFGDKKILAQTRSPYHAVILRPWQFTAFMSGQAGNSRIKKIAANFNAEYSRNEALYEAYEIAIGLMYDRIGDTTDDSLYFHRVGLKVPWASKVLYTGVQGKHVFYSAIPWWYVPKA